MIRAALTGGIATGKSTCLRAFAALGVPVIDADLLAREAVAPGTAGFDAVLRRFGAAVISASGALDRAALARIVFADAAARRDLEAIVHPIVYASIAAWFHEQALHARALAVADIPLLFETGRAGDFDAVIVAACPPAVQLTRLMARDHLDETAARRRLAAQLPIDEKRARATHVIDTSGSEAETIRQVRALARALDPRA